MSRLNRIAALTATVCLVFVLPVNAAPVVDVPVNIVIGVNIAGSSSLTVETHNVSDGALVNPSALNFSIAGAALPPAGNPWVVSSQYLRLVYSSNYGLWGVRIVTDNEDLESDPNDAIDTIPGAAVGAGPDGVYGTPDDIMSYAGLINLSSQDPSVRVAWAWQVFANTQANITAPTSAIDAQGALTDNNVGAWNSDWAYLADKNDGGYVNAILEDADNDGQVDDPTYGMIVVGGGGTGGSLAQHPAATPKAGDGDIVTYISARFANTNWGDPNNPVAFMLGAGSYDASLYVELIHE